MIEVRAARPDELAACAALYERVLRETFTWQAAERHQADHFLKAAEDEDVFVALDGGRIVAVASLYRPDEFLHSLYVEARGRGIGKALLDHVSRVARGPITLKVQLANARAQDFYQREGFRVLEYGEDEPGVPWLKLQR